MKNNQNSIRNINISVECFNNDNFKSINLLKKIDPNKYSKILKPKVTLNVTGVFKNIKLDKMPVKTGFDSFIVLNNNSIDLYTNKNIKSLFDNEAKIIQLKDYKKVKTFSIDDLYDLTFLIKLNNDYTVNSVYIHYGESTKTYLSIGG